MNDSEDYPLMTVGELARSLRIPREFVYAHAHELGAFCLRLGNATGALPRSSNAATATLPTDRSRKQFSP
jgi:hypothetical protein